MQKERSVAVKIRFQPRPAVGAHDAAPDLLVGWGDWTILPITHITRRFSRLFTLHYIKTLYSGLRNFKDYYGDANEGQCLGRIAEINAFSAFCSRNSAPRFEGALHAPKYFPLEPRMAGSKWLVGTIDDNDETLKVHSHTARYRTTSCSVWMDLNATDDVRFTSALLFC